MAEDYFNKIVRLRMQTTDREEKQCHIRVKVALGWSSSTHRKDLTVQLTDDDDPYFFFYVSISEDDFSKLKTQQGLRVDFSSFPHNVVNLLENCVREGSSDDPKFLLHLVCSSGSSAQLEMIETNPFKHLTHLSLKLVAGSDAALKKHLAQCVKSLKEEKSLLQERLSTCQTDLSRAQQLLDDRTRQLASIRAESSTEVAQLVSAHGAEISSLREESKQALSAAEERLEQLRSSTQESHSETVRRLEKQAGVLSESLQRLTREKEEALESLRQTRNELSLSQQQHHSASSSLDGVKSSQEQLQRQSQEKSTLIGSLEGRVAQLEQQLHDKEKMLAQTAQLLEKTGDQKDNAVGALTGQQNLSAHLEEKVEALTGEVAKGNEIIKRMHQELRESKTKIKNRNLLAVEQEKLLANKEADTEQYQQQVDTLTSTLRDRESELESARAAKKALDDEVLHVQDELQKSQNVINYLNRQVTDYRLGQQHAHGSFESHTALAGGDGTGVSALTRPFASASSWTGGPSLGADPSSGPASHGEVDVSRLRGRQPLHGIQPQATSAGSTAGATLPHADKGLGGSQPRPSAIPVPGGSQPRPSAIPVPGGKTQRRSVEAAKVTRKDSGPTAALRNPTAAASKAGATTTRAPIVPVSSAHSSNPAPRGTVVSSATHLSGGGGGSAGAVTSSGGFDPRYLQGVESVAAMAFNSGQHVGGGKGGKAANSFSSAYFPQ